MICKLQAFLKRKASQDAFIFLLMPPGPTILLESCPISSGGTNFCHLSTAKKIAHLQYIFAKSLRHHSPAVVDSSDSSDTKLEGVEEPAYQTAHPRFLTMHTGQKCHLRWLHGLTPAVLQLTGDIGSSKTGHLSRSSNSTIKLDGCVSSSSKIDSELPCQIHRHV